MPGYEASSWFGLGAPAGTPAEIVAKLNREINAALADGMVANPGMAVFGEDVAVKGGVYGVTKGLRDRFGASRVFDTLLDETSILGLGLGARYSEHHRLFVLMPMSARTTILVLLATVLCVATPIKIWNNARIEHKLQEQDKLLLAAKIEAAERSVDAARLRKLASFHGLVRMDGQ